MNSTPKLDNSHAVFDWLVKSVTWTVGCSGGWIVTAGSLIAALLSGFIPAHPAVVGWLLMLSFGFCHFQIWRHAVAGLLTATEHQPFQNSPVWNVSVQTVALMWWLVLVLFQLACIVLIPLLIIGLFLGNGPVSSEPLLRF